MSCAREALADFSGNVLILSGDVPMLSPQTMIDFLDAYYQSRVAVAVLTVELADPGMYGRVIMGEDGYIQRIVEARDASSEELAVKEINTGIYAVDARFLFEAVGGLNTNNDQKEYYLTDMVELARRNGLLTAAIISPDADEVMGINDRVELALASARLKDRINLSWMRAGVTMIDPGTTYVEASVKFGQDVTVWPNTYFKGKTIVENGATIGPDCLIEDSRIGESATIHKGTVIKDSRIRENDVIGPLSMVISQ